MKADASSVVVKGFSDIRSESNPFGKLQWYCAPDSWKVNEGEHERRREGQGGKWRVKPNDPNVLVIHPPAKKDFWRKTYYEPVLCKDDGPILYATLDRQEFYTIQTSFQLTGTRQFDQAGLCVRIDMDHWIKTGIEVVDEIPRLSCVVTNVCSDWSTQRWTGNTTTIEEGTSRHVQVDATIRIHCRGTSFVVEAQTSGTEDWEFIRIAHMSQDMQCKNDPLEGHPRIKNAWSGPGAAKEELWAGVFACCPEDQQGGMAVFTDFSIRKGSQFDHNAEGNVE